MQGALDTLEFISWNTCQKSWKRKRKKLGKKLGNLSRNLLILMQEVKSWRDDIVGNFRVLSERGKDCGVLIPSRWQGELNDVIHGECFTLALVGSLACGSIHSRCDVGSQRRPWSQYGR
eukprot:4172381-Karenia_brevis.AAC.1